MSRPPDEVPDALHAVDLAAWTAPPPPPGLADAVLARVQAPPAVAPPVARHRFGAALGAVVLAGAAIAAFVMTRPTAPPPVALGAPPVVAAPAGATPSPTDESARSRALEQRIAVLEAELARLDGLVARLSGPPPVRPAVPTTRSPAARPPRPNPYGDDEGIEDPFSARRRPPTDPFATSRGSAPDPAPSDPLAARTMEDPFGSPHGAPACDADALVADGVTALSSAAFAAALGHFDAALRCRPGDARVTGLAFSAACQAHDLGRARALLPALGAAQRPALVAACQRAGLDALDADAGSGSGTGTLDVDAQPVSGLLVDGVDTHKITPAVLTLPAGVHKVTFAIDGNRYTYAVTIRPHETVSLRKNLR